ncbi:MAG: hypothetical protein ACE5FH_04850 [Candidatus Zixiibacteriota bacterium]
MIRDVLQSIDGADTFATISLVLFFAFFVTVSVFVLRLKKSFVDSMAALPLDSDQRATDKDRNNE